MHLKRFEAPKAWPVHRKGTKYLISRKGSEETMPLVIVLRDLLKIARTSKEIKRALVSKEIIVNGRYMKDKHYALGLFDVITVIPLKKSYAIVLGNKGKFEAKEVSEKEAKEKIAKIIDKRLLKGKRIQINLSDGRNYLTNIDCKVKDSVLVNFEKKMIEKCIPFKENQKALIITGKNAGEKGKILKVDNNKNKITFLLEKQDKEIEIQSRSIIVLP